MKKRKQWKIRLKWTLRRLRRNLRQMMTALCRTEPDSGEQSPEKRKRLMRLGYRILKGLIRILRVILLIRELVRLILKNFQHSAKN